MAWKGLHREDRGVKGSEARGACGLPAARPGGRKEPGRGLIGRLAVQRVEAAQSPSNHAAYLFAFVAFEKRRSVEW